MRHHARGPHNDERDTWRFAKVSVQMKVKMFMSKDKRNDELVNLKYEVTKEVKQVSKV